MQWVGVEGGQKGERPMVGVAARASEARALRKLSRSVARTTRGPQPPRPHPFHASPWLFRQGFFGFCAAALLPFCRRVF